MKENPVMLPVTSHYELCRCFLQSIPSLSFSLSLYLSLSLVQPPREWFRISQTHPLQWGGFKELSHSASPAPCPQQLFGHVPPVFTLLALLCSNWLSGQSFTVSVICQNDHWKHKAVRSVRWASKTQRSILNIYCTTNCIAKKTFPEVVKRRQCSRPSLNVFSPVCKEHNFLSL